MRIKAIHIPVLAALLSLVSCSKELSREQGGGVIGTGDFTAVIDGVKWTAADSTKGASILGGVISLSGISADNQQLNIYIADTVPGIYTLDQGSFSLATFDEANSTGGALTFSTNQGTDTSQAGGVVTVKKVDKVNKTISGTFTFKMYRGSDGQQKKFTQGVFNLHYSDALPPANASFTMQATINGTAWKAQSIFANVFSNILTIDGSLLDGSQAVYLIMPQDIAPGSYDLDTNVGTYFGYYQPSATVAMASSSGTLTILENDPVAHRVRGNFNFQATIPLGMPAGNDVVTNGSFSIQYN